MGFVRLYANRYDLTISEPAERAWRALSGRVDSRIEPVANCRRLQLYAHAQEHPLPPGACPRGRRQARGRRALAHVRVERRHGIDFRVQAVVATQAATAGALHEAIRRIEDVDADEFSFVCHGATHHSVACCFLLAAIAYPRAEICLTTARTRRAAESGGLYA